MRGVAILDLIDLNGNVKEKVSRLKVFARCWSLIS